MTITTPKQMESGVSKLEKVINEFEKRFDTEDKDQDYYHLVIIGEYNRDVCNEVERKYKDAGWSKAVCKTSSENGERAGLTSLQLYR